MGGFTTFSFFRQCVCISIQMTIRVPLLFVIFLLSFSCDVGGSLLPSTFLVVKTSDKRCHSHHNCSDCVADRDCGWCTEAQACISGTFLSPPLFDFLPLAAEDNNTVSPFIQCGSGAYRFCDCASRSTCEMALAVFRSALVVLSLAACFVGYRCYRAVALFLLTTALTIWIDVVLTTAVPIPSFTATVASLCASALTSLLLCVAAPLVAMVLTSIIGLLSFVAVFFWGLATAAAIRQRVHQLLLPQHVLLGVCAGFSLVALLAILFASMKWRKRSFMIASSLLSALFFIGFLNVATNESYLQSMLLTLSLPSSSVPASNLTAATLDIVMISAIIVLLTVLGVLSQWWLAGHLILHKKVSRLAMRHVDDLQEDLELDLTPLTAGPAATTAAITATPGSAGTRGAAAVSDEEDDFVPPRRPAATSAGKAARAAQVLSADHIDKQDGR